MNWKKTVCQPETECKVYPCDYSVYGDSHRHSCRHPFYNMEKNVVSENTGYMEYTMERNKDAVATKINSINMSTQFFPKR